MSNTFLARPGQTLEAHLRGVEKLTAEFAGEFGTSEYGKLTGYAHDFGKGRPEWQRYMLSNGKKLTHAPESAGMIRHEVAEGFNLPSAYCIYGHHGSLPDWMAGLDSVTPESIPTMPFPDELRGREPLIPELQRFGNNDMMQMFIRMLFSSLVDADRLDAERSETPEAAEIRTGFDSFDVLQTKFDAYMEALQKNAKPTHVNQIRAEILEQCLQSSGHKPGFFELNVPTGGGKTLASMAFALRHLKMNGMKRIVSVIPYNSIIEQAAAKYKEVFGEENVLEHHSQFDPNPEHDKENDPMKKRIELAMENWDAPVIVTTTVQLFESLLQGRASGSRKIHNLTKSIIILDEAQKLPPEHMNSILSTLRCLVEGFGCTVVLCSATIPNLSKYVGEYGRYRIQGLPDALPMIENPEELAKKLCRTTLHYAGEMPLETLAGRLNDEKQVLCIVNTRRRCRDLYQLLDREGKTVYHLSAAMCPAHRRKVLELVRNDLKDGKDIAVATTSIIEAGVDIDVACVFREIAGLDSIAQAAGRCNREGLRETGDVYVFKVKDAAMFGTLNFAVNAAEDCMTKDHEIPPLSPQLYHSFFSKYYTKCGPLLKRDGFDDAFQKAPPLQYQFRSFGEKFHMIDEQGYAPLVVLYGDAANLIAELKEKGPSRSLFRKLQQYTVNVPVRAMNEWAASSCTEEIYGVTVQIMPGIYDKITGIDSDNKSDYNF